MQITDDLELVAYESSDAYVSLCAHMLPKLIHSLRRELRSPVKLKSKIAAAIKPFIPLEKDDQTEASSEVGTASTGDSCLSDQDVVFYESAGSL